MSKKSKVDPMGDSDELQALFDSIAADPFAVAGGGVEPAATILPVDDSGDNDELQALFDAVAEQAAEPAAVAATEESAAAASESAPVPTTASPAWAFSRATRRT